MGSHMNGELGGCLSAMRSIHVMITGRVQGVGYRNWCVHQASDLGLSGWVRNRRTGEVEAVLCGEGKRVEEMLVLCKSGPSYAIVEDVEVLGEAGPVSGPFESLATE